jgi:hypothetical protein
MATPPPSFFAWTLLVCNFHDAVSVAVSCWRPTAANRAANEQRERYREAVDDFHTALKFATGPLSPHADQVGDPPASFVLVSYGHVRSEQPICSFIFFSHVEIIFRSVRRPVFPTPVYLFLLLVCSCFFLFLFLSLCLSLSFGAKVGGGGVGRSGVGARARQGASFTQAGPLGMFKPSPRFASNRIQPQL